MKRSLYLGLDPARYNKLVVHYPIIKVAPRELPATLWEEWPSFACALFTSRQGVAILLEQLGQRSLTLPPMQIAVGRATQALLPNAVAAKEERAEGMFSLIPTNKRIVYLHSSRARPVLLDYLQKHCVYTAYPLYDTLFHFPKPIPNLEEFDEVIFTSPSTVDAFFTLFPVLPLHITPIFIGDVTEKYWLERAAGFCHKKG